MFETYSQLAYCTCCIVFRILISNFFHLFKWLTAKKTFDLVQKLEKVRKSLA